MARSDAHRIVGPSISLLFQQVVKQVESSDLIDRRLSCGVRRLEPGKHDLPALACFASVPTYAYATYASVSADVLTTGSDGLTDSYASTYALAYSATPLPVIICSPQIDYCTSAFTQ